MFKFAVSIAFTTFALVTTAAHAQTFPSRQINLIVPFPPGGSTDAIARIMADRMRPALGQPVIIENVGGAGGSIAVGRVARATPDGHTIDIGQWDTHVGSIIYKLDLRPAEGFRPDRAHLHQPAADGRQEEPAGKRSQEPRRLDEAKPRQDHLRQPERGGAGDRRAVRAGNRPEGSIHPLSRRRSGDDRSHFRAGRPPRGAGRGRAAADSGRHHQGDREFVAATLAGAAGHSDLGRSRACTGSICRDGSASLVHAACRRTWWRGSTAPWRRRSRSPPCASALPSSASTSRRRSSRPRPGLAAFHEAEIKKWWPIIKAAGVKPE